MTLSRSIERDTERDIDRDIERGIERGIEREHARQQALLRTMWRDEAAASLLPWLATPPERLHRGLQAYAANAGAAAERALAAAFPTVAPLLGDEAFAALARAFWQARPPLRGDLAEWGAELPAFIADSAQLADEPYLADVARLVWAVHGAERAADGPASARGLERLADADPSSIQLVLQPGSALVVSRFPVVAIRAAHGSSEPDRFEPVRAALAAGRGEAAWVWRRGWRAQVLALGPADAAFNAALLAGSTLGAALDAAFDTAFDTAFDAGAGDFDFGAWLTAAVRQGWLAEVAAAI